MDRQFPLAFPAASQQQIGHVGAADQDNERGCAQEQERSVAPQLEKTPPVIQLGRP